MPVKTIKVRRIGNSRGILFPKSILKESGISDKVKVSVKNKVIMLTAVSEKKVKKWSDFRKSKQKADVVTNAFDETEWTW